MMIKEFLDNKPTLGQILEFVELEAQRIAKERKKQRGINNKIRFKDAPAATPGQNAKNEIHGSQRAIKAVIK